LAGLWVRHGRGHHGRTGFCLCSLARGRGRQGFRREGVRKFAPRGCWGLRLNGAPTGTRVLGGVSWGVWGPGSGWVWAGCWASRVWGGGWRAFWCAWRAKRAGPAGGRPGGWTGPDPGQLLNRGGSTGARWGESPIGAPVTLGQGWGGLGRAAAMATIGGVFGPLRRSSLARAQPWYWPSVKDHGGPRHGRAVGSGERGLGTAGVGGGGGRAGGGQVGQPVRPAAGRKPIWRQGAGPGQGPGGWLPRSGAFFRQSRRGGPAGQKRLGGGGNGQTRGAWGRVVPPQKTGGLPKQGWGPGERVLGPRALCNPAFISEAKHQTGGRRNGAAGVSRGGTKKRSNGGGRGLLVQGEGHEKNFSAGSGEGRKGGAFGRRGQAKPPGRGPGTVGTGPQVYLFPTWRAYIGGDLFNKQKSYELSGRHWVGEGLQNGQGVTKTSGRGDQGARDRAKGGRGRLTRPNGAPEQGGLVMGLLGRATHPGPRRGDPGPNGTKDPRPHQQNVKSAIAAGFRPPWPPTLPGQGQYGATKGKPSASATDPDGTRWLSSRQSQGQSGSGRGGGGRYAAHLGRRYGPTSGTGGVTRGTSGLIPNPGKKKTPHATCGGQGRGGTSSRGGGSARCGGERPIGQKTRAGSTRLLHHIRPPAGRQGVERAIHGPGLREKAPGRGRGPGAPWGGVVRIQLFDGDLYWGSD